MVTLHNSNIDIVVVRGATRRDLEDIGNLWVELIEYHRRLDARFFVPFEGRNHYMRYIYNALRDDSFRVFVAESAGNIVGYIIGYVSENAPFFPQPRYAFIADICVTANCRCAGTGKALVREISSWFLSRGLQSTQLNIAYNNEISQKFWRSLGCRDYLHHVWLDLDGVLK
jgi:ribosomal protein S18 acetylase RimI-like enzyme